jgi:sensor domain CHASE-containing protein
MRIRRKVSLIVTLTMVGCVAVILAIARLLVIDRFAQLEEREVRLNVQRAANALSEDLAGLSRTIEDYAAWDQTYAYMATPTVRYSPSGT